MATTYIHGLGLMAGRDVAYSLGHYLRYAANPIKTRDGKLVRFQNCQEESAVSEMLLLQKEAEAATGRTILSSRGGGNANLMIEVRQSFLPGEVDEETALKIGCKLAEKLFGETHQYVVATHVNTGTLHTHIRAHALGMDYRKFHMTKYTYREVQRLSDELCRENGLSVVIQPQGRGARIYSKASKRMPWRTILRNDIDRNLDAAKSFDDFIGLMRQEYFVKTSGKYLTFRHRSNGQTRPARSYTLGDAYTEKALRERIMGVYHPELPEEIGETYSQKLKKIQEAFATVDLLRQNSVEEKLEELYALSDSLQSQIGEDASSPLQEAYVETQKTLEQLQRIRRWVGNVQEEKKKQEKGER